MAYYKSSSTDLKELGRGFFKNLDFDGDGKVSLHEFLGFMKEEGYAPMNNRYIFKELDGDGSDSLDFWEVLTLYYILKSGRPFCEGCGEFIKALYFTCTTCFDSGSNPFCLCSTCYGDGKFIHNHGQFMDNYALLEAKRKSSASSMQARQTQHKNKRRVAFKALEIAVASLASNACAIL
ncbi:hypothetical protein F0562_035308 [Nyssa sinensis]|uniref:EF-hand domain-containing protein n=1 Tax=Nyssa sinensis TaxID=561372 RepID=A0A5J5AA28_9ASTE|nr:hypothetical protein F0562_035308 [Nyssa sinensis]